MGVWESCEGSPGGSFDRHPLVHVCLQYRLDSSLKENIRNQLKERLQQARGFGKDAGSTTASSYNHKKNSE